MKTRLTELFGIKYPIIQGGMQNLGLPKFASTVSNAGGMGTINIASFADVDAFREAVKEMNDLTDKPYFVNISLVPNLNRGDEIFRYIDVCAEGGVKAIETAGASPDPYIKAIKDAGIKLFHKTPTVRHAIRMEQKGVDAITIAGYEAAGHPSEEAVGTMVLLNKTAQSVSVPVMAAGGIADGRGLAAALAMGAEGVVMGTRFAASAECPMHQNFKDLLLESQENQTVLIQKSIHNMARVLDTEAAQKCLNMEAQGATLQELMSVIAGKITKRCYETGDTANSIFAVGPAVGLIHEVKPVKDIMEEMMAEAETTLKRAAALFD